MTGPRLANVSRWWDGVVDWQAAYFEVSPEVLSLTGLSEFHEWSGLVQTLGRSAEGTALEFIRQSPQRLEKFQPWLASRLCVSPIRWPGGRPTTAADVFKTLASTLHAVSSARRDRLFDVAVRVADTAPQHLDRLLKAIARLMPGVPDMEQDLLLGQCLRVAVVDAEAAALLSEYLPEVLSQLVARMSKPGSLRAWRCCGIIGKAVWPILPWSRRPAGPP